MPNANVLFLPGLLEDADVFEAIVASLGADAACSVADLTRSDSIPALAADVLKQAPAGPLLLAGHSMGGYVALEVQRQAPQRVARLALLNTNARPDTPEGTANRQRLMELAGRDFEAVINTLMPKIMTEEHVKDPVLTGIVSSMARGVGKEAFLRQQRAIIGRIDSRPHLAAIRCPTLVVAARGDQLMPVEVVKEMADAVPGARLEVVENSGHMAPIEQPERVAELMKEWAAG